MAFLNRLYRWYGKHVVLGVAASILILSVVALAIIFGSGASEVTTIDEDTKPQVTVSSIRALGSTSGFTVVGTVNAVREAQLQAESSGRITSVNVELGDTVRAGTILATIENSSESAALLQAEGAYEAALAGSLQSDVSLDEAKAGARNVYRDTFSTADSIVRNTIDMWYSNSGSVITGFRIAGSGRAPEFIATRKELDQKLSTWSLNVTQNLDEKTEEAMLEEAESTITAISNLAVSLAPLLSDEDISELLTDDEFLSYTTSLATARASLDDALTTISRARQTLEQAKVSAVSPAPSQSSAQIKSALGTLRSAQANYEKTLVRTPISGVVNALYVKEGTSIAQGAPAALVANNNALEITTALGEEDQDIVREGDAVFIDNKATGTVTHIAPAVDPLSGKMEVKIGVDGITTLKNGSTVSVSFTRNTETVSDTEGVTVPLSALKLLASGPIAFSVSEENVLVARPVVLGPITGESVVVTNGLTLDDIIVVDARGLKEGDAVTVVTQ